MSLLVDVAEAVRAELAEATFSLPFTALRAFRHDQTLPEGKELRVSVVPKNMIPTMAARGFRQYEMGIYVAVMRAVAPASPAEIDPLTGLVEELVDFFHARRLAAYPQAACVKVENNPCVSTEHLEQRSQFTSLITLTFKVLRPVEAS